MGGGCDKERNLKCGGHGNGVLICGGGDKDMVQLAGT